MFKMMLYPTQIGFFSLYGILLFASLITFLFRNSINEKTLLELKNRIKTWGFIITSLFFVLSVNEKISIITFMIISFFAFHEYVKNISARKSDKRVLLFCYLAIPIQYLWILMGWYGMAVVFIPVYIFLSIPLFLILSKETHGFLKSVGSIFWGFMASVFCLSHVALLFTMNIPANTNYNATSLVFFLLFLTEFNDVLQYVWGKFLGKKKITPNISPNKTVAGFLGGIISTACISAVISPYFTPFSLSLSFIIGLVIGVAGFIGDLCMSAIKRDIGVKDYSSLLPGHGGVLDRLDSLIYTAPLFFHILHYLYY